MPSIEKVQWLFNWGQSWFYSWNGVYFVWALMRWFTRLHLPTVHFFRSIRDTLYHLLNCYNCESDHKRHLFEEFAYIQINPLCKLGGYLMYTWPTTNSMTITSCAEFDAILSKQLLNFYQVLSSGSNYFSLPFLQCQLTTVVPQKIRPGIREFI